MPDFSKENATRLALWAVGPVIEIYGEATIQRIGDSDELALAMGMILNGFARFALGQKTDPLDYAFSVELYHFKHESALNLPSAILAHSTDDVFRFSTWEWCLTKGEVAHGKE